MTKLTLEEIAPLWAKVLRTTKDHEAALGTIEIDGHMIDICAPAFCIVGEAYGFSAIYGNSREEQCQACGAFGGLLLEYNPERFRKQKERFVKHWNEVHVK